MRPWLKLCVIALFAGACSPDAGEREAAPAPTRTEETPMRESEPPPAAAPGPTVVMLGDSLTAGYGLAADAALPARLQRLLSERGAPTRFVNAGVSGDTTGGGLDRYGWSVRGAGADLLVLALGANDYLNGADPARAEANLAAIIELARDDGLPVVLVGLATRSAAPAGSPDAAYAAIYPRLAERFDLPLYPALMAGVATTPSLLQPDGLHPTAEGVDVIAERLAPFLEPHVAAVRPPREPRSE